jgi:hypothetical protein
VSLASFTKHL